MQTLQCCHRTLQMQIRSSADLTVLLFNFLLGLKILKDQNSSLYLISFHLGHSHSPSLSSLAFFHLEYFPICRHSEVSKRPCIGTYSLITPSSKCWWHWQIMLHKLTFKYCSKQNNLAIDTNMLVFAPNLEVILLEFREHSSMWVLLPMLIFVLTENSVDDQ